jgi:methylenetetrahydrofolate reductase (NADPH)
MNKEVPGVHVPNTILKRLEDAGDGVEEESVQITLELIEQIRQKQGVHGIHLMAIGWEDIVPRIVTDSGLLPAGFTPSQTAAPDKVLAAH